MRNLVLLAVLLFAFVSVDAQTSKKEQRKAKRAAKEAAKIEEIKTALEEKDYVFVATQALPTGMRSVNLDGTFDVRIEGDEIICYMPFYGRAYSADYGSNEGPFDFEGVVENYEMETTKKGYQVKFDTKKGNDNMNFIFEIGKTGSSTLSITSTNRQSITYYGDIKKEEEEEEDDK